MRKDSQADLILEHMKTKGPITPIEALELYGCFRLAAVVFDLKEEGHPIETVIVHAPNDKRYARYHFSRKI